MRFRLSLLIFALALVPAASAFAASADVEGCLRKYQEILDTGCGYGDSRCDWNTLALARKFMREVPDFDPSQARVLYFYNGANVGQHFRWRNLRDTSADPREKMYYPYHVVLEYRGRVFDLDHEGGVVKTCDFIRSTLMNPNWWGVVVNAINRSALRVRPVPLNDFVEIAENAQSTGNPERAPVDMIIPEIGQIRHDGGLRPSDRSSEPRINKRYPASSIGDLLKACP